MTTELILVLLFAMLFNIPFGYWRQGLRKLSVPWFLAIHLPILVIIPLRMSLGISKASIPFVIAAAVLGQIIGGKIRKRRASAPNSPSRPHPGADNSPS
jgi:hypothetical protein